MTLNVYASMQAQYMCECACSDHKEHKAERYSKSQAGWMIMALAWSLYIAHNALMLAWLCHCNTRQQRQPHVSHVIV